MASCFFIFALSRTMYAPIMRFSSTVMRAKTCRPSGTWARPSSIILLGAVLRRSVPSSIMEPLSAGTRPLIVCRVVVLPAPLAPMRETSSPSLTSSEMPFMARTAP